MHDDLPTPAVALTGTRTPAARTVLPADFSFRAAIPFLFAL